LADQCLNLRIDRIDLLSDLQQLFFFVHIQ